MLKDLLIHHKIHYLHVLGFSPSEPLLARYKNGLSKTNEAAKWQVYVEQYAREIDTEDSRTAFQHIVGTFRAPCFLCAEQNPAHCHRRILVEQMKEGLHLAGWAIKHL